MEKEKIIFFEDSSKIKFGGGQEISLLVLNALKPYYSIEVFDYAERSIFLDNVHEIGIETHRLSGYGKVIHHHFQSFSSGWLEIITLPLFFTLNLFQVAEFLFKHKRPIIFCSTKKVLILGVLISFFFKSRIIYFGHNINDPNRLISRTFNWFLKRCDIILGISQTVCDSIPLETKLLYGAVDFDEKLENPKTLKDGQDVTVAVCASLYKWKGIEYFIKSFSLLKNKNKVEFWICGDGPEREALEKSVDSESRVVFKGFIDFPIIAKEVDIIVLPSVEPEAFGMNIIKAMHFGIPIIATNIGAHVELIDNELNGLTVSPEKPEEIAEKIDCFIEDSHRYFQISEESIRSSKKFNKTVFNKQILAILRSEKNEV